MLLIKVKCCLILLVKKSFWVILYFIDCVEETSRPNLGDVKENVIPLFVFLTLYHLPLKCSLPGGPPWTTPRSSRRARLPLGGEACPSAVGYFTIYRFDVSPPFSRLLRSLRRYPLLSNSFSARFTVLRDSRRSLAIRRIPGQHCRWLFIRSRKYIYTALARWGRLSSE